VRVIVATPTRGQLCIEYLSMMMHLSHECRTRNIGFQWHPCPASPCWLARCICVRNMLRDEKATHMLMLDDDVGVKVSAIMKLIDSGYHVAAVAYRKKLDTDTLDQEYVIASREYPTADADGFARLDRIGAGCLLVSRAAIEAMCERFADLAFSTPVEGELPGLFREQMSPTFVSEDYSFCDRARACGFAINVLVDADTSHTGGARWDGNMGTVYAHMRAFAEKSKGPEMKALHLVGHAAPPALPAFNAERRPDGLDQRTLDAVAAMINNAGDVLRRMTGSE
jgi:hypothetical protein